MIVVYHGKDEVLITTDGWEESLLTDYFTKGGRDLMDYDRITQIYTAVERPEIIRIDLKCTVDFE